MIKGRIVVGVTGGVAAFKAASLVSQLVQNGAEVQVVMTRAAEQFVGPATFAALSGRPAACEVFEPHRFPLGAHIELAQNYDLLCVAPATAHFLAQAAHGLGHDLLSTLYLSFTGRVVAAPAMNSEMWNKPSVQRNLQQLRDDGVVIVGPDSGWLSCRTKGDGRMSEPETILQVIAQTLSNE